MKLWTCCAVSASCHTSRAGRGSVAANLNKTERIMVSTDKMVRVKQASGELTLRLRHWSHLGPLLAFAFHARISRVGTRRKQENSYLYQDGHSRLSAQQSFPFQHWYHLS